VGIPIVVVVPATGIDLHEPDAPLHQPARDETFPSVLLRGGLVQTIARLVSSDSFERSASGAAAACEKRAHR
jgi:hypothetical protein